MYHFKLKIFHHCLRLFVEHFPTLLGPVHTYISQYRNRDLKEGQMFLPAFRNNLCLYQESATFNIKRAIYKKNLSGATSYHRKSLNWHKRAFINIFTCGYSAVGYLFSLFTWDFQYNNSMFWCKSLNVYCGIK